MSDPTPEQIEEARQKVKAEWAEIRQMSVYKHLVGLPAAQEAQAIENLIAGGTDAEECEWRNTITNARTFQQWVDGMIQIYEHDPEDYEPSLR